MSTLFISDLHLQPEQPKLARAFLSFLETQLDGCERLYILGDLFEAWIGDDFENEFVDAIKSALTKVSKSGIQLFFMHGNRDFLIGQDFCEVTGCELLDDPTPIDLYGQTALLMHGDTLCTEDIDYLKLRAMVRNPAWQQQVLSLPIPERLKMAADLRGESQAAMADKDAYIMDVTEAEVERVMSEHNVRLLIHGHTHRPARHDLTIANEPAERIVLGDWGELGWVLRCDDEKIELESFPIS